MFIERDNVIEELRQKLEHVCQENARLRGELYEDICRMIRDQVRLQQMQKELVQVQHTLNAALRSSRVSEGAA